MGAKLARLQKELGDLCLWSAMRDTKPLLKSYASDMTRIKKENRSRASHKWKIRIEVPLC